jgi:hypothetical protein
VPDVGNVLRVEVEARSEDDARRALAFILDHSKRWTPLQGPTRGPR